MWIFLFFIIFSILIATSTIKIEINEKILNSYKNLKNLKYVVSIKAFNKVKILSFKITQEKIGKSGRIINIGYREILRILRYIFNTEKIEIEKFKLNLRLGTENSILTSYIVSLISTIISILLARKINDFSNDKYKYQVIPEYIDKNVLKLSINCIISIKLVHIIYMIYVLKRKDDVKYGRTSNRRFDDNCNEQYKRYGGCKYNYR